jgi:hypothetical protein
VLGQHVDESVEVAEKPLADQSEERPDVQLHLLKLKKIDNSESSNHMSNTTDQREGNTYLLT